MLAPIIYLTIAKGRYLMQTQDTDQLDRDKIAAIRAELPALSSFTYLNTGTNGPLPRRSNDILRVHALQELEEGRITFARYERYMQIQDEIRATLATILRCQPDDIALTHNTTEGINIALLGIDWHPGDEVVTSVTEHPGALHPIYLLHQRYGVHIRMTKIGQPDCDPIADLRQALTSRTRAVVLSHVSWTSGAVLPIRELADAAHQVGALFICDAAQSCGMVPSAVFDLGVDAYACPGQKWLCGPEGTGGLFVRPDRLGDVRQTFIGYMGIPHGMSDLDGNFLPTPGAKRFESSALYPPSVAAFNTSLHWLTKDIGLSWIYDRIAALGQRCHAALARLDHVAMITPADHMAGLIHFTVNGIAAETVSAQLTERGFAVRSISDPQAVRVSTGFYNTEAEIDQLVVAIDTLQRDATLSV
jgi:L-cysteine/cystine lyase